MTLLMLYAVLFLQRVLCKSFLVALDPDFHGPKTNVHIDHVVSTKEEIAIGGNNLQLEAQS